MMDWLLTSWRPLPMLPYPDILLQAVPAIPDWTTWLPPDFQRGIRFLAGLIAVMWGLELTDTLLLRGALNQWGIRPRKLLGLPGILWAPLLHGNLRHLAANTGPLAILGSVVLLSGLPVLYAVTIGIWFISGAGAWCFGRSQSNHLWASGLVFGYLGFLLLRGYFERSWGAIATAVFVGFLYGGVLWGLLPQRGKSWMGHLFGFLGGGLMARYAVTGQLL